MRVIAVTKSLANEHNKSLLAIPGYRGLFKDRIDRQGDGVALFIDDSLSYSECNDLNEFAGNEFEYCFIELVLKKVSKSIEILNKIKANVNNDILLTLYNTLILSYFNYCSVVWAACKLFILITEKKLFA